MNTRKLWLIGSLLSVGSTLAHASVLGNPLLAISNVPEPASVLVGAGLLLVGLGVVRKRQENKK